MFKNLTDSQWKHRLSIIFHSFSTRATPAISPALIHWLHTASLHCFFLLRRAISLLLVPSLSVWTLFLTGLSSLMPLLACLPSAWMEKETIELFLLWSQSVRSSGSTSYLLQMMYLHNVRHLCQGKPSPPSFNVNMHLRQSLNVAPSLQVAPLTSFSASSLLFKGCVSSFLIECHLKWSSLLVM